MFPTVNSFSAGAFLTLLVASATSGVAAATPAPAHPQATSGDVAWESPDGELSLRYPDGWFLEDN